jgi:hypothetical protein
VLGGKRSTEGRIIEVGCAQGSPDLLGERVNGAHGRDGKILGLQLGWKQNKKKTKVGEREERTARSEGTRPTTTRLVVLVRDRRVCGLVAEKRAGSSKDVLLQNASGRGAGSGASERVIEVPGKVSAGRRGQQCQHRNALSRPVRLGKMGAEHAEECPTQGCDRAAN